MYNLNTTCLHMSKYKAHKKDRRKDAARCLFIGFWLGFFARTWLNSMGWSPF